MRSAVVLLLALALCAPLPGQPKGKDAAYYPLKVGTTWVYKVGGRTLTVRVVKHEPVGAVTCARLEAVEGDTVKVEHVAIQADGVYRYQADGKKIEPPLCILKLPPKVGATWKLSSTVDGFAVTGTCTLGAAEVAVPAGTYKALTVTCADFEMGGRRVPATSWLAPGVGLVKQRLVENGTEVHIELTRFTPGK
jgi:hypothetical protein